MSDSARIARKLALATARTRRWRRRQRNGVVSLRIVVPEEVALTLAEDGLLDAHLDDDPGALAAAIERLISVGAGAEGNVSGRLQKSKFAPRRNCFREGRHRHQKGPAVQEGSWPLFGRKASPSVTAWRRSIVYCLVGILVLSNRGFYLDG